MVVIRLMIHAISVRIIPVEPDFGRHRFRIAPKPIKVLLLETDGLGFFRIILKENQYYSQYTLCHCLMNVVVWGRIFNVKEHTLCPYRISVQRDYRCSATVYYYIKCWEKY